MSGVIGREVLYLANQSSSPSLSWEKDALNPANNTLQSLKPMQMSSLTSPVAAAQRLRDLQNKEVELDQESRPTFRNWPSFSLHPNNGPRRSARRNSWATRLTFCNSFLSLCLGTMARSDQHDDLTHGLRGQI